MTPKTTEAAAAPCLAKAYASDGVTWRLPQTTPLLIKISKDFATLWTTIDPIGNVALFAGLTASLTRVDRHWTALRACIYAAIIFVAAMTVGQVSLFSA